jgi:UDP-N-acetylglucosamine transferase subunit ALG13
MNQATNPAGVAPTSDVEVARDELDSTLSARSRKGRRLRICLAASGGGHVRQLLDLERAWSAHDYLFVSEDTPLTRSIGEKHPVRFIPHFALGQIGHGKPLAMAFAAAASFFRSAALVFRERPDVVITTGAGAVYFVVMWARLVGAKIVHVETFARFEGPSWFGRIAAPLAHLKIAQSKELGDAWPGAIVFDPLRSTDPPARAKQSLLFVTVGATLPFDRLVEMVAELKAQGEIPEHVVVQTGVGGYAPPDVETYESLRFDEMQSHLRDADIVICHAGTGSLITALREGCRVVAVPRERGRKEHYDDHQLEIANSFAARGLIEVASSKEDLIAALGRVRHRPRVSATLDHAELIEFLSGKLAGWA